MSLRAALFALLAVGCGDDGPEPDFPADYRDTYQEVRDCRFSLEHGLVYIRVWASPEAVTAYTGRVEPFATGAVLLKEQYGDSDMACAGSIMTTTVMTKLDVGSSPQTLDWRWQSVTPDRHVEPDDTRCASCHVDCGVPAMGGYEGTCTVP